MVAYYVLFTVVVMNNLLLNFIYFLFFIYIIDHAYNCTDHVTSVVYRDVAFNRVQIKVQIMCSPNQFPYIFLRNVQYYIILTFYSWEIYIHTLYLCYYFFTDPGNPWDSRPVWTPLYHDLESKWGSEKETFYRSRVG